MLMADRGSQLIVAPSIHLQPHTQFVQDAETASSPVQLDMDTHDIFLSHSGVQKGFAKDLYKELSRFFSTFFDITHHSLPPGEPFPPRILKAAKSCKLALVLLSEEFVVSKWPMIELSTFVEAAAEASGSLKLLPLFFKLSPEDLKSKLNMERWRESWETLAARQDGKHPIDASRWERALETVRSLNGVIFDKASGSWGSYIDEIMQAVSVHEVPAFKFSATSISGKDRLCKIILDEFENMELRPQSSSSLAPVASQAKSVSMLCLYGLPGSGKTTLCKCLIDHFRPSYGSTKVLHLEFLSTPTHADKVKQLKELLQLTGFRSRVSLDGVSHLEQVEHLLKNSHFSSYRVFLVVDNISDNSWEEVYRILRLGVGHGSKIILVARTLSVLRPILHLAKSELHWICGSMAVPSIDEMEATEILLQTSRDTFVASDKNTLRQMEIVKRIVHMCGFHDPEQDGGRVQLPLLMKAMGALFRKYSIDEDLEGWESDMDSFWKRVETYKQKAVIEELLGESFKALLDEHLQLMFLDVALFILRLDRKLEAVSSFLSMMHGLDSTWIELKLRDLERHCFLAISKFGAITIHDVYLEFAKSITSHSKYVGTSIISCRWESVPIADANVTSMSLKKDCGLRALILEGGEKCERVDLQGLSGLKAVALMDCKSLVVLGLAGLSSLAILEIRDCPMFNAGRLECHDSSLVNIKSLHISTKPEKEREAHHELARVARVQTWEHAVSYLRSIANYVLFAPFRQPASLRLAPLVSQMRGLQVLHLENTGTTRLELGSCSLPQLRNLTVKEHYLERFELGDFPSLSQFVFSDFEESYSNYGFVGGYFSPSNGDGYKLTKIWRLKKGKPWFLLPGRDLLSGCPQLTQLRMESAFFKQGELGSLPAGLVTFELHFFHTATELPDLSLSARSLKHLDVGWCEKLERVNLLHDVGFKSLQTLILQDFPAFAAFAT